MNETVQNDQWSPVELTGGRSRTRAAERAHNKIAYAIKTGKIIRPKFCELCGYSGRPRPDGKATIQAHHHKGYELPLEVQWLCVDCHALEDPRLAKEDCPSSKLTEKQVGEIRLRYKPRTSGEREMLGPHPNSMRTLASEFGVARSTIRKIIKGKTWK